MLCTTIQKELREIERDKASGVTVQLKSSNLQRLTGFVEGRRFRVPPDYGPSELPEPSITCHGQQDTCKTTLQSAAGPRDTAYDGGLFVVDIQLGEP